MSRNINGIEEKRVQVDDDDDSIKSSRQENAGGNFLLLYNKNMNDILSLESFPTKKLTFYLLMAFISIMRMKISMVDMLLRGCRLLRLLFFNLNSIK